MSARPDRAGWSEQTIPNERLVLRAQSQMNEWSTRARKRGASSVNQGVSAAGGMSMLLLQSRIPASQAALLKVREGDAAVRCGLKGPSIVESGGMRMLFEWELEVWVVV